MFSGFSWLWNNNLRIKDLELRVSAPEGRFCRRFCRLLSNMSNEKLTNLVSSGSRLLSQSLCLAPYPYYGAGYGTLCVLQLSCKQSLNYTDRCDKSFALKIFLLCTATGHSLVVLMIMEEFVRSYDKLDVLQKVTLNTPTPPGKVAFILLYGSCFRVSF